MGISYEPSRLRPSTQLARLTTLFPVPPVLQVAPQAVPGRSGMRGSGLARDQNLRSASSTAGPSGSESTCISLRRTEFIVSLSPLVLHLQTPYYVRSSSRNYRRRFA